MATPLHYNFEQLKALTAQYPDKLALMGGDRRLYRYANSKGWLDDLFAHKKSIHERAEERSPYAQAPRRRENVKWTFDRVLASAQAYDTYKDWREGDPRAHGIANKKGWLHEIKREAGFPRPATQWSYEEVEAVALSCSTPSEFRREHPTVYTRARKMDWLQRLYEKMLPSTDQELTRIAMNYRTPSEFLRGNREIYLKVKARPALAQKIFTELKARSRTQRWDYERLKAVARKYPTRSGLYNAHRYAYRLIHDKGWLELLAHMPAKAANHAKKA